MAERVIDYIEYSGTDDRPFSVTTDGRNEWDFEWCEANETVYYHQSGFGRIEEVTLPQFVSPPNPPVKIYIRTGLLVQCYDPGSDLLREATPEDFPRLGLERIDAPLNDPFEDAIEGEVVYCRICDDHLPDDRENICSHIWEGDGGFDGPGHDETNAAIGDAFVAWIEKAGENVSAYDFDDWRKGAWAAWSHLSKSQEVPRG